MYHQGFTNVLGWLLIGVSVIGGALALAGVVHAFTQRPQVDEVPTALHETYYVIQHTSSWVPFAVCLTLFITIGLIGYIHTDRHLNSQLPADVRNYNQSPDRE